MNIPNIPHISDSITIDGKTINPSWYRFFEQLVTEMQKNLSQEGIGIPSQSSSNISILQAGNPPPSLIHNKDNGNYYLPVGGVYKQIPLT